MCFPRLNKLKKKKKVFISFFLGVFFLLSPQMSEQVIAIPVVLSFIIFTVIN